MTPVSLFVKSALIVATITTITACDGYRLSINDRAIGPSTKLFQAYDIADKSLRKCLSRRIEDEQIQHAGQLDYLNCSHEGVRDLTGLGVFVSLTYIDLSSNQVRDISELNRLRQLQRVELSGNRQVNCDQVRALGAKPGIHVNAKQCR